VLRTQFINKTIKINMYVVRELVHQKLVPCFLTSLLIAEEAHLNLYNSEHKSRIVDD